MSASCFATIPRSSRETLPGRNHYDFPVGERPPWQWHVAGHYPGWSS
jgi:hypothetical protein